ncbi:MAG: UvrD-helicase domain-containing protein [Endomicrobium sp.]|jgi:ATP-dependent exoDNAse (exonuclease V) beta subunit|nr:UvrD-helicase domain-containing protein [Endomicrobium sp.]
MSKSQIVSVQASAGSGKTYNLAKRYIHLLFNSDENINIKNIIAVTFTNKATVEMKYRVINYLKKAALEEDSNGFFDDLKLSKQKIAKKSKAILNMILTCYDSFNISTIDSFKNRILKSCAMSIDISPNFIIEQDYSDNLMFSLESFLQKTKKSDNLKSIALKCVSQYLMKDSGWLPKESIYGEILKIFNKSGNSGKDIFCINDINFRDEVYSMAEAIEKKVIDFSKFLIELKLNAHYGKAVSKVFEIGAKLFFSASTIPKRFKYDELEYLKNSQKSQEAENIWHEIHNDICSLCQFYVENYYGIYSQIYSEVSLEFDKQSKKDGVVYLNEINKKIVNYFENDNNIMPEIYYKLSEKYKHFLIDEFQDTSTVQWAGIKRFIEESLAGGGSFFFVGDVKQAIYSFRGGKSELFDSITNEFSSAEIEKKYLNQNFRTRKVIVDFNNKIFSLENIKKLFNSFCECEKEKIETDFTKMIEAYDFSQQKSQEDCGYVEINTIDKDCDDIDEAIKQKFISCVLQISERFNTRDIAVLCRSNEEILKVSLWLLENNYEVESQQTLNIKNNSFIKQIVSVLMFINSPIDSLSFSSFLFSEIFSKASGISNEKMAEFIFGCKLDIKSKTLYKVFREKYKDIWNEYFEELFVKAGFIPIYELTLSILDKFNIVNFPEGEAFIVRFLEIIKDFETQKPGLKNFLEYFKSLSDDKSELYIKNSFGNGIKVMTVHKSKGLEFPVVIVPYLKLSSESIRNPYFDDFDEKIKLLNITKELADFSPNARKVYEKEKLNSLLGELNVLYVSMTRSKYEFYGIVPPKAKQSNNLIPTLFDGENFSLGQKQKYLSHCYKKEDVIYYSYVSAGYRDINKYPIISKRNSFDITETRKKGTILHYTLSKIITVKDGNIEDIIKDSLKFTEVKFPFEDVSFVRDKLKRLFSSKEILEIFSYEKDRVFNEKEIVDLYGKSYRIDKLIVSDHSFTVIDFKSSNYDEEENKKQLENYVLLMSEIYPDKKAFAYILDIGKNSLVKYVINNKCSY